MSIGYVARPEGCWEVGHALHPQTAFMIFFPGTILAVLAIALLFSSKHIDPSMWEGLAAVVGLGVVAVGFDMWTGFGHSIQWDNSAVYIRQIHAEWGRFRQKFARLEYDDIEGIKSVGWPRGVPPRFPLIEVVVKKTVRLPKKHFVIDPNYLNRPSLAVFFDDLRQKAPQVNVGASGALLDHLMPRFTQTPR